MTKPVLQPAPLALRRSPPSIAPAAFETGPDALADAALATRPAPRARPPALRYLGFEITPEGREYSVQVSSDTEPRLFVLRVTHEAFASQRARFQDAPDLCYRKLGRELGADPDLVPGRPLQLSDDELLDYRVSRERPVPGRKRRGSG